MKNEIEELHHAAVHGAEHESLAPVSMTMAISAILVAVVALLSHRAHNESLLAQIRANALAASQLIDRLGEQRNVMLLDLLDTMGLGQSPKAVELRARYGAESGQFRKEEAASHEKQAELVKESISASRDASRFDLGEGFLEMALVLQSITLLTRQRRFWKLGIALGGVGLAVVASVLWMT